MLVYSRCRYKFVVGEPDWIYVNVVDGEPSITNSLVGD